MSSKKTLPVRILCYVFGGCLLVVGLLASLNVFERLPLTGNLAKWTSALEGAGSWWRAGVMLLGLIVIAVALNGVDAKGKDSNALNSKLVRTPIKRMFPIFLLPTFAAFCIGFLYPFVKGLFLSFTQFKLTRDWKWNGLANYTSIFSDKGFTHAFWYTAVFTLVSLVIINVLAFAVAYALTRGMRGSNIFRTVFFMPNLIGGIVLGYIWSTIFEGILVNFDTSLVLESKFGFWGLVILMAWQQIGYMMIIYIAGIQAVPEDIIEAAKIDGASSWKTLWHVTIPNVMPSITICTFLTLTNSFKLFDQNVALTGGRPFNGDIHTTEMLALNIYRALYETKSSRGPGQAKAVIFFVLVAVISITQLSLTRKKEVQQ